MIFRSDWNTHYLILGLLFKHFYAFPKSSEYLKVCANDLLGSILSIVPCKIFRKMFLILHGRKFYDRHRIAQRFDQALMYTTPFLSNPQEIDFTTMNNCREGCHKSNWVIVYFDKFIQAHGRNWPYFFICMKFYMKFYYSKVSYLHHFDEKCNF